MRVLALVAALSGCPHDAAPGQVALIRGGSLRVVDLSTCGERVLVARGAKPPVRFSADGRWISFGARVVAAGGGSPLRPGVGDLTWAPKGHAFAGITPRGGVVVGLPDAAPRSVLPDGWGATGLAFDPAGRFLAVSRTSFRVPVSAMHQEIWAVNLRSGRRFIVYHQPKGVAPPQLAGWSADGQWVLWWPRIEDSGSIAADGLPLLAAPAGREGTLVTVVPRMLVDPGYMDWCGGKLVLTSGFDRIATHNKRLVVDTPPAWRRRTLVRARARAWGSLECARGGRKLVVQSQPSSNNAYFFATKWSLWLVGIDGSRRRLTVPPRGSSDESPRWSRDGSTILFVRSRKGVGALYAWKNGRLVGPIFSLGYSLGYYGRQDWWYAADWRR